MWNEMLTFEISAPEKILRTVAVYLALAVLLRGRTARRPGAGGVQRGGGAVLTTILPGRESATKEDVERLEAKLDALLAREA